MAAPGSDAGHKKRALISVSDKNNLEMLARGLSEMGYELVSTGGSASAIEKMGIKARIPGRSAASAGRSPTWPTQYRR